MTKKLIALLLTLVMAVSLAACGSGGSEGTTAQPAPAGTSTEAPAKTDEAAPADTTAAPTEAPAEEAGSPYKITDEKVEISVLCPFFSAMIEDPNEIKGVQAMEESTNVHVNWITYDTNEMLEKWTQILATGDLPDIMFPGGTNKYPGGFMQGVDDGIVVDINEYKDLFPNYFALLNSSTDAYKQALEDDGIVHSAKVITGTNTELAPHVSFIGQAIRLDILEKLGLDVPETIDELHEALIRCRDELGMTAPMILETDGGGGFSNAWGVATGAFGSYLQFDSQTQTVQYAALLDGFYDYVFTMREWYKEGLIDKNFTSPGTFYTSDYSSFQNDTTLYYSNWLGGMTGNNLHTAGLIDNEKCFMQAVPGFRLTENSPLIGGYGNGIVQGQDIFINANSKVDREILCKWVDYLYTTERMQYNYYGIEDESYYIDSNGDYQFTDQILNNPDGLSISDALYQYAMRTYMGYQNDAADAKVSAVSSPDGIDYSSEAGLIWRDCDYSLATPSGVVLSPEESEIANMYNTALKTMVSEYMVKTILGQIDTPKEEFIKKLHENGVDQLIQVYQDAFDRFNNR